jgi:cellulose synthase operon protein YhjQ
MHRSDDITNLFSRFGASADSYREIEHTYDYIEEPPVAVKPPEPLVVAVAQASTPQPVATPVEPAPAHLTLVVSEPIAAPVAAASSTALGSLLAEVMHKRETSQSSPTSHLRPILKAKVIAVVSSKGGVGKTTLSGALASALKRSGGQTLAVDLDPQNALCLHLGVSADQPGLIQANDNASTWRAIAHSGFARSQCLPYGVATEQQRRSLEQNMEADPYWLGRHLSAMGLGEHDTVIIDTPPGATPYLSQALEIADQVLIVALPDAASYTSLNQMDRLLAAYLQKDTPPQCHYVINQLDDGRAFSVDMSEVLKKRAGNQLLGVVHQDHFISEALAYERNPLAHTPSTRGCQEILDIAGSLSELLMLQDTEESIPS